MHTGTIARREDSVLIVIDEQERLAAVMGQGVAVVDATVRLVRAVALLGVPMIVTRQYPKGLGDLEPRLAQAIDAAEAAGSGVLRVDKTAFDCFGEPEFVSALASTGGRQLIVAGMETHICVAQTTLAALRAGFDVHVAADACCSRDSRNNDLALGRMRAAGAVASVSESVMYEWTERAGTDEFRALLGIVKES